MTNKILDTFENRKVTAFNIQFPAACIADTQKPDGEIPWSHGDKTDPWDHVEAIMGLSIGGYFDKAKQGFLWLANNQLEDGSWYATYRDGKPEDMTHDTNMSAYIAVGLFHYFLITEDISFLSEMWDTMAAAMNFAISFQTKNGEIYWAKSPEGITDPMALLTGSSSIYMSLKCGLAIAEILQYKMPYWEDVKFKLGRAIKYKPHLFNITKSRFSMDWFYPILCGAVRGADAKKRIDKYWKKYVINGQGVRCVSDHPWVTLAETSELSLALSAIGNMDLSKIVFSWICEKRFDDGSYWCGHTFPDMTIWPEEKVSWTNAVVLMAADALFNLTPASCLFSHQFWLTKESCKRGDVIKHRNHINSINQSSQNKPIYLR